jgi:predicted Zn-dependent peptidase
MNYKLHKLTSGLRLVTVPMPSLESVTVTVWVKTGSRNEEKKVGGISHFLEHMVFKGSAKRPTARDISEAVDAIGGEFNAATSKDWTNFYIKASKDNLDMAMDVLSDMVLNPIIKEDEIEREKGTIIQEIAMYEDTPMMKIGEVYEELTFADNPLGWDTAGTKESVKSIKRNDFVSYRKTHYYLENMLVSIAGGVSEKKAQELTKKYFGNFTSKDPTFKGVTFKDGQTKSQVKIQNKKSEQAHFILGFMSEGRGYKGRFAQSVLSSVLGGGMSSRMFTEVRERRGLAYSVRTSIERYQDVGYIGTYVGTDPKKVEEAVKVVLEQYNGLASGKLPIFQTELTKAKEYIKGHLALSLEDTEAANSFFGEQELFLGKALTPEEIYREIDAVTLESVYFEAKKIFVLGKMNLALIGPFKNEEKFIQLLL